MRVLIIGLFSPDYMIAIANALAPSCQVSLMLTRENIAGFFPHDPDPIRRLKQIGAVDSAVDIQLINYPKGGYAQKIKLIQEICTRVHALQPEILHYQSGGDPWIPLALPFLRHYPLVVTIHDAAHHPGDRPPRIVLTLKNALLTRLADQIIVHGKQQAGILLRQYFVDPAKINAVYIGPYEIFKQLSNDPVQPSGRTILFFGRVSRYKGIDTLINAAPLIQAKVPDLRIVIAGAGDDTAIQKAARAFPGLYEIHNHFIEAEQVRRLFLEASLVVLPYRDATQSGIIPNAYMFRRPVVATRVGSIPEVVDDGKTGLLIDPDNEQALAEAVVRLLLNPEVCRAMGDAAAARLERDLSWQTIAGQTLQAYENAIS